MNQFGGTIALVKNQRGCYVLDTVKGCSVCGRTKPNGCYGDCYAKNITSRYGIDFKTPVKRDFYKDRVQLNLFGFEDCRHEDKITKAIEKARAPFVRIGDMGDPSEDWQHTTNVCSSIARAGRPIVIITKHWRTIPDELLTALSGKNICINTSISALDSEDEIVHRLCQYNRLKAFCNSALRVVTCDFNRKSEEGRRLTLIQERLLKNGNVINTVFRPSKNNQLVLGGIINVRRVKFMGASVLASVLDDGAYLGYCPGCPDQCGINHNRQEVKS